MELYRTKKFGEFGRRLTEVTSMAAIGSSSHFLINSPIFNCR